MKQHFHISQLFLSMYTPHLLFWKRTCTTRPGEWVLVWSLEHSLNVNWIWYDDMKNNYTRLVLNIYIYYAVLFYACVGFCVQLRNWRDWKNRGFICVHFSTFFFLLQLCYVCYLYLHCTDLGKRQQGSEENETHKFSKLEAASHDHPEGIASICHSH